MSDRDLSVVQFVHPGFEYNKREHLGPRSQRSGVMRWKPGRARHDRKVILTLGSLLDAETRTDHASVPLVFWGEWEPPSVFWRVESPGKPLPAVLHAPFLPAEMPTTSVQNTDPMAFGDAFIYSNCLQAAYGSLRTLTPGSIVLFGRYGRADGRPSFSLDTCLVVDRVQKLEPIPFDAADYGTDVLTDAVLSPLFTEGARDQLSVYRGARRYAEADGPFSFFPARPVDEPEPLFARPELKPTGALEGVVSPGGTCKESIEQQTSARVIATRSGMRSCAKYLGPAAVSATKRSLHRSSGKTRRCPSLAGVRGRFPTDTAETRIVSPVPSERVLRVSSTDVAGLPR